MDEVRIDWVQHRDEFRDGGRTASHRGPCQKDAAHLVLWHACEGEDGRHIPTMDPKLDVIWESGLVTILGIRFTRCCGLRGRYVAGLWVQDS